MADLTLELLDQLEALAKAATPGPWTTTPPTVDPSDGFSLGVKIGATRGGTIYATPPGGQYPLADAKHIAAASPDVVLALVAAAKERDQLRDAARLRDHATIEAWNGSATGLDAAALATAQAEALEKLSGIVAPTAEQQRDAAVAKVAALIGNCVQLRYKVSCLSEQLTESQLARIAMSEEVDKLRATIDRIKAFVADNAIINDFELEEILKGEAP